MLVSSTLTLAGLAEKAARVIERPVAASLAWVCAVPASSIIIRQYHETRAGRRLASGIAIDFDVAVPTGVGSREAVSGALTRAARNPTPLLAEVRARVLEEDLKGFQQKMKKRDFYKYNCGREAALEKLDGVFEDGRSWTAFCE